MGWWTTFTGQRCPNSWLLHGVNVFGVRQSKRVRCDLIHGHAGRCSNATGLNYASTRDFRGER